MNKKNLQYQATIHLRQQLLRSKAEKNSAPSAMKNVENLTYSLVFLFCLFDDVVSDKVVRRRDS
jgi:hypothetical protein